jgi:hypothetical protein
LIGEDRTKIRGNNAYLKVLLGCRLTKVEKQQMCFPMYPRYLVKIHMDLCHKTYHQSAVETNALGIIRDVQITQIGIDIRVYLSECYRFSDSDTTQYCFRNSTSIPKSAGWHVESMMLTTKLD